MEFLVKTTLGWDQIMAYQKASGKSVERVKTTALRTGLILFGGLTVFGSFTSIGMGHVDPGVLLGMVLGALAMVWGLGWWKYQAKRLFRRLPPDFTQEFYFNQDGVVAESGQEQVTHDYSVFFALAESEQYFFLFLDKRSGYMLDKSRFITGQPAEFAEFIKKRTGKPLPFVKI